MRTGRVKFFDRKNGFGFIVPDDEDCDVMFHVGMLPEHLSQYLQPGQPLLFDAITTVNGMRATRVEDYTIFRAARSVVDAYRDGRDDLSDRIELLSGLLDMLAGMQRRNRPVVGTEPPAAE